MFKNLIFIELKNQPTMKILRNILAVVAGWIIGSTINMSLISLGQQVFPMDGFDPNDMEALAAAMPNMDFEYFIFPFLAHALGTFAGAFIAALIAATHKMKFALAIGVLFFIGGLIMIFKLPSPLWFTIVDLLLAYFPMAWLAGKLAIKLQKPKGQDSFN